MRALSQAFLSWTSTTSSSLLKYYHSLGVSSHLWFINPPLSRRPIMSAAAAGAGAGNDSANRGGTEQERPLKAQKAVLRKEIAAKLKALDDDYITAESKKLSAWLLELEVVQKSTCLSIYLSMPSKEVPTYPLLQELLGGEKKRQVYVPKVIGPNSKDMVMIPVQSYAEIEAFPRSKWGIPEPPIIPSTPVEDGAYVGKIDLVIMPGVAFDARCNRLGHGKGYYDCFLERVMKSNAEKGGPVPYTVALALREQIIDDVPVDRYDLPLDAIATPDRLYTRG